MERGYNAIALNSCYNCWVRRVRVVDADNAVLLVGTDFTTVSDVYVGVTALRGVHKSKVKGLGGHHALNVANGQNNLLTRCGSRGGGAGGRRGPAQGARKKARMHATTRMHGRCLSMLPPRADPRGARTQVPHRPALLPRPHGRWFCSGNRIHPGLCLRPEHRLPPLGCVRAGKGAGRLRAATLRSALAPAEM